MTQLLLFNVTNGLIIGAFYVLMALGLSLILNLSNVINFAHGGFLVIGGYIAYTITPYVGFWGALLLGSAGQAGHHSRLSGAALEQRSVFHHRLSPVHGGGGDDRGGIIVPALTLHPVGHSYPGRHA